MKGHKIINEEKFEGYDGIPDPRQRDETRGTYDEGAEQEPSDLYSKNMWLRREEAEYAT